MMKTLLLTLRSHKKRIGDPTRIALKSCSEKIDFMIGATSLCCHPTNCVAERSLKRSQQLPLRDSHMDGKVS